MCSHRLKAGAYKEGTQLPHNLQISVTLSLVPMVFLTFSKHLVSNLINDFHLPFFFFLDGHLPKEKRVVHRKLSSSNEAKLWTIYLVTLIPNFLIHGEYQETFSIIF